MENEETKEEIYLEDALEEQIGACIACMKAVTPGSEAHMELSKIVERLYTIRLKYTEIEMKYDGEEKQREHELTMKAIDYEMAKLAAEMHEKEVLKAEGIEFLRTLADGAIRSALPSFLWSISMGSIVRTEYNDNKFYSGTGFKMVDSAANKLFKIG